MLKRIFKSALQRSSSKKINEVFANNNHNSLEKTRVCNEKKENPPSPISEIKIESKEQEIVLPIEKESEENIIQGSREEIIEKPSEEKKTSFHEIEKKLSELCIESEELAVSTNWEPANKAFNELLIKWKEIDLNGEFDDFQTRFKKAHTKFKKRYESHAKTKENIKFRENICTQIEQLTEKADLENSLSQLEILKQQWDNAKEIPPRYFEILEKKYRNLVSCYHKRAEELKLENEKKIQKEKELAGQKENVTEEKIRPLEKTETVNSTDSPIEATQQDNKELTKRIEELLNLLKTYTAADDTRSALNNIKEIQDKWEKIKNGSIKKRYSNQFKKLFKDYFAKLKFIQQKDNWKRWENYTNKHLLCEQAENLLEENDLYKVSREIKAIWEKWRTIGRAPKEKNDIIWDRFNKTRRELNSRCKDFFNNLQKERLLNLETKIKLCEEAEKLKDSEDWEDTANALKDIQLRWKEAGRAPQPQDDELYQRLRNVCNHFFEKRSNHYDKLHERQSVHKDRKKELCTQADELINIPWKDAFKKIKDLKNQWRSIPPASRRDEQALWTRFNKSIDEFIAKIEKERPENLVKKNSLFDNAIDLSENIKDDCNLNELGKKIENMCIEWKQTGPAPKEKDYDLNAHFEDLIKKIKNKYDELMKQEKSELIRLHLKKENLIDKLEKTVAEAIINSDMNSCTDNIKKIEDEWKSIITASPLEEEDELIEKRYRKVLDAFYDGNEELFINHTEIRKHNLNTKRKLCIQLEHLAEIDVPDDMINTHKSHTIADEIKFSIENNFGTKKNKTNDDLLLKYQKIQNKWDTTGPVPIDYYEKINMRYQRACHALEQKIKG